MAIPAVAVVALVIASFARRPGPIGPTEEASSPAQAKAKAQARRPYPTPGTTREWKRPPKPVRPNPAPAGQVNRAMKEARLRSTFNNYRTAVATGNSAIQKALRPILISNREASIRMAQESLAKASRPNDRDIANRTLTSLRDNR